MTNRINLTSPHQLLAIVPFVLGFRPTNSVVVLCLRDHRLGLTYPAPSCLPHGPASWTPTRPPSLQRTRRWHRCRCKT
jgi:hypothetical protein